MSGSVKVAGAFKEAAPYVKVGGNWKFAPEAWSKVSGTWKKWFLAGGLNDSDFNIVDDKSYAPGTVAAVAIQSDGKIVIGGVFGLFNGVTVNRIARLNSDGSLDTAFTTNAGTGANGTVYAVAIQPDGKIIIGGAFTILNGVTTNRIIKLNSDGSLDTAFTTNAGTGANGNVYAVAIQSDGKIVIGGTFTAFNGLTVNRIARLNSDGSLDTAFTINTGSGASSIVYAVAVQSDGKIVIGGAFTILNGLVRTRLAILGGDLTS